FRPPFLPDFAGNSRRMVEAAETQVWRTNPAVRVDWSDRLEVDEAAIDVDPRQPDAEAIADVKARVRPQQFPFDRRRKHPHERALGRSARHYRVERLTDA